MISLIKKTEYKKSLWKNGKGQTSQIAIYPENADVTKNDFEWRLSSAEVKEAGSFSSFLGYDRKLILWKGDGLKLNNTTLLPFAPFSFSGDLEIYSEPIGMHPIIDLGLIYKKDQIVAELSVLKCFTNIAFKLNPAIHFLFFAEVEHCSVGDDNIFINNLKIEIGDTIKIDNKNQNENEYQNYTEFQKINQNKNEILITSDKKTKITFFKFTIQYL